MAPRHTQRQKAKAVAVAERLNSSELAGKELGIAARTIRRWRDEPEMADIIRKTRAETAEDVTVAMVLSWTRLIERLQRDEVETRDLIILAGVATDKAQLLTGGATERTETHDWKFDDHETVERAGAIIVEELTRRSDERAAEDAVGSPSPTGATPADD